ncbi:urease accessory protein UreE [Lentibacter algarum]|uniref:urease accessory protein UreE n=1 Tax=Lentibacter algarum TaxID=576131 RepID=UPI001C066296|nr:urease accessory protein UreE [Lentibacter algarum]MBU2980790.1 urease accessory protein UreE [Lentibacter algarum]
MTQPTSQKIIRAGKTPTTQDTVELTYDARFLRRKVLTTSKGTRFLVDLEHTTSLDHGDAFELENGALIEVIAAREELLEVTGEGLARIAWHIGNRHTPCQIEERRLVIQRDKVIRDMLHQIGAQTREVSEPFVPEGGAYGHGRTHGHDHTASHNHHDHDHEHAHDHTD